MSSTYLAFDLGAESGRAVAGTLAGDGLRLEEIHRFPNRPVLMRDTLTWDFPGILAELQEGLVKFARRYETYPAGISCDSWGVDFGLLDTAGNLLANPVHYRDRRTQGMPEKVFERVPRESLYQTTGLQVMALNTLFQIESLVASGDTAWKTADRFLLMADLVNAFFCGATVVESSLASTTHLYDARQREWAWDLIAQLGYPKEKFPQIVPSGTRIGTLDETLIDRLGLPVSYRNTPVIASLSHDTGAAVAAVPADPDTRWAFLSSGTWSLLGVERDQPILTQEAREANFTNEGGAEGTVRFLKNIMGLWILQECRRTWEQEDAASLDYSALLAEVENTTGPTGFIDPDDARFFSPGNMPERVRACLKETGQPVPEPSDRGGLAKIVLESLALKYRMNLEILEELTGGHKIEVLHIVGGGGKNRFLNQTVADVLGIPVLVGPTEATALGNIVTQAVAMFEIEDLWAGRKRIRSTFVPEVFEPRSSDNLDERYRFFRERVHSR